MHTAFNKFIYETARSLFVTLYKKEILPAYLAATSGNNSCFPSFLIQNFIDRKPNVIINNLKDKCCTQFYRKLFMKILM